MNRSGVYLALSLCHGALLSYSEHIITAGQETDRRKPAQCLERLSELPAIARSVLALHARVHFVVSETSTTGVVSNISVTGGFGPLSSLFLEQTYRCSLTF